MQVLEQLRTVNTDRMSIDDAIAMLAFGKLVQETYESKGLDAPEFVEGAIEKLDAEIDRKRRDYLEMKLKQAKADRETLLTAAERRSKKDAEIARLEKQIREAT